MFKTLGSLVVAMTGTSALLGWMDPSLPAPAETPTIQETLAEADTIVGEGVDLLSAQWRSVRITAGRPDAGGTLLAARSDAGPCHFRIGIDGHAARTVAWCRQQAARGADDTICIEIARTDTASPMSRAQWNSARAIVQKLRERIGTDALGIHLDRPWADLYGLSPDVPVELEPIRP